MNRWFEDAACKGKHAWFYAPEQEHPAMRPGRVAHAKSICATCPVIEQCREAASNEHAGIWAGTTSGERGFSQGRARYGIKRKFA